MRTITMSPNRRLTLPAEVRQRLGLAGGHRAVGEAASFTDLPLQLGSVPVRLRR